MTRSIAEVEFVLDLGAQGLNQSEIARRAGLSRTTVRQWLRGNVPARRRDHSCCLVCGSERPVFPTLTRSAYAYLLGLYLGDGCISEHRREVYRLRIFQFSGYPRLVEECVAAMRLVMPNNQASVYWHKRERVAEVSSFSKHWPCLFPQHGPGRKHHRAIKLESWQRQVGAEHPRRILRGLIHSDGYRGLNTIRHPKKTYAYPRYQFCNHSEDIRQIFCTYCDMLGIEWRQMNRFTISVACSDSVARMDRFVGPKG